MDSQGIGQAFASGLFVLFVACVIGGGLAAIGLWELFWWLWDHVAVVVK